MTLAALLGDLGVRFVPKQEIDAFADEVEQQAHEQPKDRDHPAAWATVLPAIEYRDADLVVRSGNRCPQSCGPARERALPLLPEPRVLCRILKGDLRPV